MSKNVVIKVDDLHKNFRLPRQKITSLKSVFTDLKTFRKQTYDTQKSLSGITFEVKKGEFFGIVGRNGSGKSTLLKIIAKIYQPTKGEVSVKGKLVPFIELGVGFNPELTGRENIYLNGAMLGFTEKQVKSRYKDIVEFSELEKFMAQKLKNYSSGMQVRLAFSVATILAESDILLLDEVLAVGDADFQRKCFDYFRNLKKNKKTVVFVSHDMNAIQEYCTKAILIDKGKIRYKGKPEKVAKEYIRLFNPAQHAQDKKRQKLPDGSKKWGLGTVDITSVKIKKSIIDNQDKTVDIEVVIKANKDFENSVIPGIVVKNQAGQPICGTNTKIIKSKTPALKKNEVLRVKWILPNVFSEGKFIVEPAVADGYDMSICQWWDGAIQFEVVNDEKTPYIISPKIKLEVL